jgi:GTP pyrophosphokinase
VLEIYAPLASRLGIGWLKGALEDLAFATVYPSEHRSLVKKTEALIAENRQYLESLRPEVEKLLAAAGIVPLRIDARVKHLYSLWKKLEKNGNDLSKIYDLVALRLIVRTVSECYGALGAIHERWTPLPGRIKDYIALPKPSGYRSLHTTVFADEGKITEFQIRTKEMHEEAEFGIAAHWAYKENASPFKKNLAWIQQLSDWQNAASSKEFLEHLKIDFFRNRIFVFTPKGDVIDLPEGATPVDFAYAIHSDLGDRCAMARVNGKAVGLKTPLLNNDIVEIVVRKNKKPSRDWLTFVKTSKARSKIRDSLRKM